MLDTMAEADLSLVSKLAQELAETQGHIAQAEADLKILNDRARELEEKRLPDAMAELGVMELKLASGEKVSVRQEYYASIPKARKAEALQWLRDNGFGALIKNEVTIEFGREEDAAARELALKLRAEMPDNLVNVDETVHPSTLKSTVKQEFESGSPLPEELFGVHIINRAIIKRT